MKSKFMIVAACIATLTAVPASAQLLGGGGGGAGVRRQRSWHSPVLHRA